ncbi:cation-translocating P-type ATPase [uncultured Tissierella sp.]|jgi:Cd2+/Zn2+-exporting ATPase|uniref:heavy metal translocating P-type ATPase n=1 Tax=uncultured Tissierella sp. TaxID=448160 RepID=UPI002803FFB5|nr:cation-translocating P-type ATPase [uncultured Tissierella sp.]MDU5081114.1 cation-translocating P-type ATPase [Bacillota bacterium]
MKLTKAQRVWISGILVAIAFILKNTIGEQIITSVVMILAAIIAGTPILRNAISAARYWIIGIDALVSIAVIGAMFIGEYWEAAAVTFLFMLGDYLESRTIEKTRSSIKALLDLAPDTARVMRDGVEIIISPDEVVKGDQVVVKPGEKISVDGNVVEGSAYVNQSAITGESIPVNRNIDDSVFSGTIIESGYLVIEATRVGEDTTFARILQMVEEAQDKKAKTQKFLEKFSRYYTPAIIVLAIGLYLVTQDLVLALTLLVIACPGALVISTPVSIVAGIGNGAKHGVLVKGGEIMENLGKIKVLAFDKTGTLTVGKPMVTHIKSYDIEERELLRITAIGEGYSEHPLARAILARAENDLGKIDEMPEESEIITGQGLKVKIEGRTILIGNRKLFLENKVSIGENVEKYLQSEEQKGQTAVIVGDTMQILGIISIADVVREDAKKLVSNLKKLGVEKIVMLTGDNRRAAKAIAEEIGLDDFYAELLPEDKVRVLKELQEKYGVAAMVGDGVNDAPALASADLGIAIGGAGTDVAMETADVVLMSDEIKKLSHAIGLSRATVNNMRQNIYFAIAVAALLLAGVLIKTVNLSFGMLVHELSVLLVVINAVRLLGYGDRGKSKKMLEI